MRLPNEQGLELKVQDTGRERLCDMPVKTYQTKRSVVEAVYWYGSPECADAIIKWAGIQVERTPSGNDLRVYTPESAPIVKAGEWIVKDDDGNFFPCSPALFDWKYERADCNSSAPTDVVSAEV